MNSNQSTRFKLFDGAAIRALPPLKWRIKNVFPAQGLAVIYGSSGSGKSFLALDMCCAIAEGRPWFGNPTESTNIIYVCLEGEEGFRSRVAAWETANERTLPSNLQFIFSEIGLTNPQDLQDLSEVTPSGAVVVIDTLNRATPSSDENSSKDMGQILVSAKKLQRLTKGLLVLVHHTGKNVDAGMRGHSSLHSAADAAIEVSRKNDTRHWKSAKVKDGTDGTAFSFRLRTVSFVTNTLNEEQTSCVILEDTSKTDLQKVKLPSGANQKAAIETLRPLFADGSFNHFGAPDDAPCVELQRAITSVAERLTCPSDRRNTLAQSTITSLINNGTLGCHEGWLWLAT